MPTYGDAKRRDIARSVLPSTARKGARENKRAAHGRTRARVRAALDRHGDWSEWGTDDAQANLAADAQHDGSWSDVRAVVSERRGGDKLGALIRWAEAKADDLGTTPQERCAALRSMLPDNLIGWHAMTHVDHLDDFDTNPFRYRYRRRTPRKRTPWEVRVDRLARALNERLDEMGELNRRLKIVQPAVIERPWETWSDYVCNRRLWMGEHDTHDFADWVLRHTHRSTAPAVVLDFLGGNPKRW